MRLVYMILVAVSMYLAFTVLSDLPSGFRELLLISWVAVGLYCLVRFARPEGIKKLTSYERQRDYMRTLNNIESGKGHRRARFRIR